MTTPEKWVADYANISIFEVGKICYVDYLQLLRDAIISNCRKTEKGREYLDKCWILEQTKPDRGKLREKFGKGG